MGINGKTVRTIHFKDGRVKKFTGIVCDAIYPSVHWQEHNYDEPVLYLQQRRKRTKSRFEKVNEICIPLSQIVSMS